MPRTRKSETVKKPKSSRSKTNKKSLKKVTEVAETEETVPETVPETETLAETEETVPETETLAETEETVQETVQETETLAETVETESLKTRKKRSVPTKESVIEGFDDIIALVEKEVDTLRNASTKTKGVKFLRSLRKKINTLRSQTVRVLKRVRTKKKTNNQNSGFNKPVGISKEMADFAGWNTDDKKSRTDVTRYLCDYIEQKALQNPEDRRQILVENDPKLKKLLKYDHSKDDKPLTYFSLQVYLKDHFTKNTN